MYFNGKVNSMKDDLVDQVPAFRARVALKTGMPFHLAKVAKGGLIWQLLNQTNDPKSHAVRGRLATSQTELNYRLLRAANPNPQAIRAKVPVGSGTAAISI